MIDETTAVRPHYCTPPSLTPIMEYGDDSGWPTRYRLPHEEGTRWHCPDCPRVMVCEREPDQIGHYVAVVGGWVWRDETRRERRDRLGLRWRPQLTRLLRKGLCAR